MFLHRTKYLGFSNFINVDRITKTGEAF